ncbi:WUSCHEL-related homeobox 8 [Arabidopsis thaliana]|uniref:WUSCHEL-related homeobox 8 n=1 Tax=Arabidopsis thaliana TaxID=3702 RepID=WOX8_ARATH|nr:WUSCHEL related homeobox 8 [Arabidopsis thaliana]Q6X7J5.1 RecName: Full=WUSCHEL-related homeobox 8; AltName: Full=Protein STIMPY-LIKE [Arabidopsis thaliana]AAP37138.1 WOX8 protein [Arabidopsis thaliana]AED95323.1 WUSCHEL related homeobox 8 [Arabidopsis thaliana]|eukprot:NP_199410.2 WUSCHEL related homeobox 8 [Arabidopsis thaliana]
MSSSNKNWPSMFKSKPCNNNHHHQHEIDTPSYMHYSNCNLSSSFSSDRIPDPKPRWNPKPEQIRILESIFNSGTINPPREEIQRIRIRLQEYGQIGDANVFYWFQNRKSRAKHKLRVHHKSPKMSKKDKTVIPSTDADHCFGFVNQETGLYPVQNNELVVTEPAGFLFPVHNDPSAAQSAFGFGDFVVPVVTEEGMAFSTVNNGVNLETNENFDKIPAINLYGGDGNGGGNCFPPLTVPLTINQSQEKRDVGLSGGEDVGDNVYPVRMTVFINEMPIEVVSGLFNVKAAFGNDAVLINSFGQPILTDEFGVTYQPLQNGAIYYLI